MNTNIFDKYGYYYLRDKYGLENCSTCWIDNFIIHEYERKDGTKINIATAR